jgi:hypothetical protein
VTRTPSLQLVDQVTSIAKLFVVVGRCFGLLNIISVESITFWMVCIHEAVFCLVKSDARLLSFSSFCLNRSMIFLY